MPMDTFVKSAILASVSVLFINGAAHAASATNTASGTASATVVTPITVTAETAQLNFGTLASGGTAGDITSAGVGSNGVKAISGPYSDGKFDVTGQGSTPYTATVPSTAALNGIGNPANSLTANLTLTNGASRTLTSGGTDLLDVKGDLLVPGNTPADTYTGNYTVSVSY